jgi:hypothetical protein
VCYQFGSSQGLRTIRLEFTSSTVSPSTWKEFRTGNDEICQNLCEAVRQLGLVANQDQEALTQLIKPLSNCLGLSESQPIDFIEKSDISDLPANEIHILDGDLYILLRKMDTCPAWQKADAIVLYN